ncbi:MAG: Gfo/Idh/MocA family protein [Methyloligellaceae bacterium]
MTDRLRVATVGTGYFSQFHHDAWTRMDDIELAAVCSLDTRSASEAAATYGVPVACANASDMLDAIHPDLLDIVAPPPAHLELIRAAARQGVNVICQKPFCGTFAQAEEAVALARRAGILLVVHENFRFQPWYGEIKRQLEAGRLGVPSPVMFRLRPGDGQGPRAYLDRQPYFQKMERFLVHETAIHLIDVLRYLLGDVARVFATLKRLNPAIAGEDAGLILLEFAVGTRGLFDGNRLADHAAENRRLTMGEMLIEGSDGTIRLDGDGHLFLRPHGANEETPLPYDWENRGFAGDCVYRLQRHVIDHLRTGSPVMNTGADYLANLRIEDAVYASDAQGGWITLGPD